MTGWQPEGPSGRVCWKCQANATSHPYTDASLTATWRLTRITHEIFLSTCLLSNLFVSPLFLLPGFRIEYVTADLMHCVCLGIVQYCLGNIIFEICFGKEMGGTIGKSGETLGEFMCLLRLASRNLDPAIQCPIGTLTLGMLRKKAGAPKLKTKAAEGRHLVPVLVWVLRHCFPLDTPHQ